jgi:hypothetical protein
MLNVIYKSSNELSNLTNMESKIEVKDDKDIEELWDTFANICIDDNECIDTDFLIWEKGTPREEIWHYFDRIHTKGVHYLIYERE